MNKETAKAINNVSNKVNETSYKLDTFINALNDKQSANIDYISMMADIDIPTENPENNSNDIPSNDEETHSPKFYKVKSYYDKGLWNDEMVYNAVIKGWITEKEYVEIVGKNYDHLNLNNSIK